MRTRLSAIALGLCAALLAACGGGGGNPTGPFQTATPTPSPTASPTPTPAPTNNSYRPAADGDTFAYAGTLTQSFVRPPLPADGPTPDPNPSNTETTTTAVTQAVTVATASVFNGVTDPFVFHTVETDVLNGGLKTSTVTSDDFYDYAVAGGKTTITALGSNVSESDGSVFQTITGAGNGLVDILPEASGALLPANNAALTESETDPSGSFSKTTVAADGSYFENGADAVGIPTQTDTHADGSAYYKFPLLIPEDSSIAVTAPFPNPSGGPDEINVTLTVPASLVGDPNPADTPVPIQVGPVNVWYPEPIALSKKSLTDNGVASLPASCKVPASLTRTAHATVAATTTVDPVFGETDVNSTTTYTEPGIGVACVTLSDVLTQYYDLSGQTQQFSQGLLGFQSTPFQTTTTTETLGITSATVLGLSSVGRSPQLAAASTPVAARAGITQFHAMLDRQRLERHKQFYRALVARARVSVKGGHR